MSTANSPDWQLTRLRRETVDRLKRFVPGLIRAVESGLNKNFEPPEGDHWTADRIINILLDREERKRERGRSKRRRRQAGWEKKEAALVKWLDRIFETQEIPKVV